MHNSFLSVLFKASQTIALPKSGWERARPVQRFREVQLPTDTGTRTSNSVDTIFSVILFADDVLSTVKMRMIPTSAPFSLTLTQFITTRVWCFRFLVFQIRGSFPSLSGNQMFFFFRRIFVSVKGYRFCFRWYVPHSVQARILQSWCYFYLPDCRNEINTISISLSWQEHV